MLTKKNIILSSAALLGLAIIIYIIRIFIFAGVFKIVPNAKDTQILSTLSISGAEDITVDNNLGIAFLSSMERTRGGSLGNGHTGAIYLCELENNYKVTNLTKGFSDEFFPHGISLYKNSENKIFLFVINHRQDRDVVELFKYEEKKLTHIKTFFDPILKNLNDILAIGENTFYVTEDHSSTNMFFKGVENYLMLKSGKVVLFDNGHCTKVVGGISYANGINISPDKSVVYVTSTLYGVVKVYSRINTDNSLKFLYNIPVKTGADNIEITQTGDLIVGAHPKILQFSQYSNKRAKYSPSEILSISILPNNRYNIKKLFYDKGKIISGSSVGVLYKKSILIGSVFEDKVIIISKK